MKTPAEYAKARATFAREQEAKGLVHLRGKEWVTKEEFERIYQAMLEEGRRADEDYRNKLIEMYGRVPDWAPLRIRR